MKKILVVDDEPVMLSLMSRMLPAADYGVITAVDAEEATHRMAERGTASFDAILMDGLEGAGPPLVRVIRESGFRGPIVSISNNPDVKPRLMEAGCSHECDFKPHLRDKLIPFLNNLLNPGA